MGTYVYRVTAKRVKCSDGKEANVMTFAYKPYWGFGRGEEANAKMHFRSGAVASDAMAARGNITDRVVSGDKSGRVYADSKVFENPLRVGSMYDGGFGGDSFPVVQGVTVVGALLVESNEKEVA